MTNEHNGGPSSGGSGGNGHGGGGSGDDFGGREETTVVEVSRDFLIGSLGRAASALFGAGGVCLNARAMVTAGGSEAAVAELIDDLGDLESIIAGMKRALERMEFKENK
jgi:hypothetical protein